MVARSDHRDVLEAEGVVETWSRDRGIVVVEILGRPHRVLCTRAGRLQIAHIRILPGDRVTVEVSPYDVGRGRITHRHK